MNSISDTENIVRITADAKKFDSPSDADTGSTGKFRQFDGVRVDVVFRINGALADMIAAGARVLECACGPCIGMGQSPKSAGISLRTFNRNFLGRSGTKDAGVYLVSPEVAAVSAVTGYLTDPRTFGECPSVTMPGEFSVNDNMIELPAPESEAASVTVERGPNIKPFPLSEKLPDSLEKECILKVGDNITTDHIMPAGSKILPYRSNIPYLSKYCFAVCDESFPERAKQSGGGIVVGGSNYGQGSSREHAALVPLYLGIRAVITKSFARIHKANLINSGILPLVFADPSDYDRIEQGDLLVLPAVKEELASGAEITLTDKTKGFSCKLICDCSERQREMLMYGGLINMMKEKH